MNFLVAILLYLSSISTGQTYTWEQIEAISASQQPSIESIEQNSQLLLQIQQEHGQNAQILDIQNRPVGY
ncbi:MAG: hypothetical protein IPM69_13575 [Ignavibacteria bacterium]|nr:hypothetical protein [Ignavibacteria bacterium]